MRFEFNDDSQKICNSADVVNYGIQCDICGNKVLSVSNINGKRYCAGCYYKTFMKDNQKAEIDQLKQQLEEKDEQIKKRVMVYEKQFIEQTDEIYSLKQQLAEAEEYIENDEVTKREYYQKTDEIITEKDKEIKRLKNLFELNNEVVINQGKEIFDLRVQVLQQKQNQTQLAIQELEKVKEDCFNQKELVDFGNVACFMVDITDILEIINNQIKKLKGEKNDNY